VLWKSQLVLSFGSIGAGGGLGPAAGPEQRPAGGALPRPRSPTLPAWPEEVNARGQSMAVVNIRLAGRHSEHEGRNRTTSSTKATQHEIATQQQQPAAASSSSRALCTMHIHRKRHC